MCTSSGSSWRWRSCICEFTPFLIYAFLPAGWESKYLEIPSLTKFPSFFVETAGKTLEELKDIFEAKNPRKASTAKVKVAMGEGGHVLEVVDEAGEEVGTASKV